ncbi:hypothetical protein JXM83_05935 [Candidatus Woesearchaeota archaeon]|nr:hypothetical protein [Candidatus Woesearchaeota archaeon]
MEEKTKQLIDTLTKLKISKDILEVILLVKLKIKRNASIEYFEEKNLKTIEPILKILNLQYKLTTITGIPKLIVGTNNEVEEIFNLEEEVFLKKNKKAHIRYGILMGYPKCCCEKSYNNDKKNSVGYHYVTKNPWPWQLNNYKTMIWHIPCSPECKESIEFGNKHIIIREKIRNKKDPDSLISSYKNFCLHFSQNLYSNFQGNKNNNSITITKILNKTQNSHAEHTDENINLSKQEKIQYFIEEGDVLTITDKKIEINKKDQKYIYTKIDESDGCLIEFN